MLADLPALDGVARADVPVVEEEGVVGIVVVVLDVVACADLLVVEGNDDVVVGDVALGGDARAEGK